MSLYKYPYLNTIALTRIRLSSLEYVCPYSNTSALTRIRDCPSLESAALESNMSFILKEILAQFGPVKNVVFESIQIEPQGCAASLTTYILDILTFFRVLYLILYT